MPPKQSKPAQVKSLEATLWEAADRLRSRVDAAEYKHVVLGLIFLKYVSDVFAGRRETLERLVDDPDSEYFMPANDAKASVLEDRDEYASEGVFWVPEGHRWNDLRKAAKQTDIGERIDAAMDAIEKENPSLRGVLPKRYARRELTPLMLGGLIDTFSRKDLAGAEHKGLDVLGRVYEYFLGKFATAEGKLGGEFYTPRSIVRLMVEMLEPFNGRVFDPACGSGGMFVQAEEFVEAHGGRRNDISVFGQEQNPTTWRLAKMNLALRGIEANLGPEWGDSFHHDMHPDLRADFVLAPTRRLTSASGAASGCATIRGGVTGCRLLATPTSPGSSTCCITCRRWARWSLSWRTGRCHHSSPARRKSAETSSRRTLLSASSRCRASSFIRRRFPSACGS